MNKVISVSTMKIVGQGGGRESNLGVNGFSDGVQARLLRGCDIYLKPKGDERSGFWTELWAGYSKGRGSAKAQRQAGAWHA